MDVPKRALAGGAIGALFGLVAAVTGVEPIIAIGLSVVYAAGGALTARFYHHLPGEDAPSSVRLLSSASLVVTLVAAVTAGYGLDVPVRTAVAVGALVFGTGWVGELFGVAMVEARDRAIVE